VYDFLQRQPGAATFLQLATKAGEAGWRLVQCVTPAKALLPSGQAWRQSPVTPNLCNVLDLGHLIVGILPTLKDRNVQLTVLVPTDTAFASTPPQRLDTSNTDTLQTVQTDSFQACNGKLWHEEAFHGATEAHVEGPLLWRFHCGLGLLFI
jgi:hypothetical protein